MALQKIPSTIGNIIKRGQQCKAKVGRPKKTTEKTDKNIKKTAFQQMQSLETISTWPRTQSVGEKGILETLTTIHKNEGENGARLICKQILTIGYFLINTIQSKRAFVHRKPHEKFSDCCIIKANCPNRKCVMVWAFI